MKLSSIVTFCVLGHLASAAPFFHLKREADPKMVVVTQTVKKTVVITPGATQAVGGVQSATSTSTPVSTTSTAASDDDNLVGTFNVEVSSSSSTTPSETNDAQPSSTISPTTLSTSSPTPTPTEASSTTESSASSTSATSTTSSSSSDSSSSDFQEAILKEHNDKRALHGVDALTWDDTLAQYAQNYADEYDCSGVLTHSGGKYGENLALGYTTTGTVDAWYDEGENYNYGSSCSVYDHFTQVIWKSTTKVGCGYKHCNDYWGTYIVCSYDPAGNVIGGCASNVPALSS
ncbi:hypothetical protein KL921_000935 [Ogataea angusta]|uniref:SCP domain-containing protein n=1 Tax=Pichia angusta TaxID=870730 RepID=A0AAN6DJX6_PICAN|nr:uncharacterized protein KL928_001103 [Ogataea angusta]KAG7813389.1 hypothetical protein KL921_000935 [Ogataea angusta]KAG7821019.1 hypothetical protein KL928_001103 [Ogataea angusta]KAG7826280.1 hypothetical protein KL909_000332 [Ogataea angusta]KAG7836145.1 hypothetical protein KL943_001794 [Ogataea angusta]KAG7843211.1 hypothetical protein KL942_000307 [Ogataea angusta]